MVTTFLPRGQALLFEHRKQVEGKSMIRQYSLTSCIVRTAHGIQSRE